MKLTLIITVLLLKSIAYAKTCEYMDEGQKVPIEYDFTNKTMTIDGYNKGTSCEVYANLLSCNFVDVVVTIKERSVLGPKLYIALPGEVPSVRLTNCKK
jgi:hypothetical protein